MQIPYSEKLRDPRWQRKRLEVMQRDGFQCRDCTNSSQNLQVHHIRYAKEPWDAENHFLLTLCNTCHEERQELERGAKLALDLLMSKTSKSQLKWIAHELSGRAGEAFDSGIKDTDWQGENRWIFYAKEYPQFREFVEMVIGSKIEWEAVDA